MKLIPLKAGFSSKTEKSWKKGIKIEFLVDMVSGNV